MAEQLDRPSFGGDSKRAEKRALTYLGDYTEGQKDQTELLEHSGLRCILRLFFHR
jgi:hypothetical protein